MARLSSTLVQGMMNPTYAGRLGNAVEGGFNAIQQGYAQKRQRHAQESMTQIMNNGDLSDPNVVNSMAAVAQQMGQDPSMATDMVEQGRAAKRLQEDQTMQKETFRQNKAKYDFTMRQAEEKEAAKKAAQVATARISKNPEKMEEIISSLPQEHQASARAAVVEKMEFDMSVAEYHEKAKGKTPFSQDTLEAMAATDGMEDALAVYNKMRKEFPQGAKRLLLKQYEAVRQNEMMMGRTQAQRNRPLTTTELKTATEYVKSVEMTPDRGWWENTKSWYKQATGDEVDPEVFQAAVAKRLAFKSRDESYDPTPEAVQAIYKEIVEEMGDEKPAEQAEGPVTLSADDKAGYNALKEGDQYTVDGQTYTKGK